MVDVHDERSNETQAKWLALHPTVRFVARDRSPEYRKGISGGAADAEQIADRFHLLQNMTVAVQRFFERHPRKLRDTVRQCALAQKNVTGPLDSPAREKGEPTASEVRFNEVKRLQREGYSKRDIIRLAGVSRTTVTRYWNEDALPTRQRSHQNCSKVTPFHDHIVAMWNAGQQSYQKLHDSLLQNGFEHSYHRVYRYTKHLLRTGQLSRMTNSKHPVSSSMHHPQYRPRKAAWLLTARADRLTAAERCLREQLCALWPECAQLFELAQRFGQIVRTGDDDDLAGWMRNAVAIPEVRRFAKGLEQDGKAVRTALTYRWSNGQTEGQVNRLKLLKRQAYGRASFPLLRKRMLGMAGPV